MKKEPSLKERIQQEFAIMSDDHFATHYSDLYVYPEPSVRIELINWLRVNYPFFTNITWFNSQEGSNWAGAGKHCMDIPFANSDYFNRRVKEKKAATGESE